jgi:hypothetical protein
MANPMPINQAAPRTKTHVDSRTDSNWWYYSAAGQPVATESTTTSTTRLCLASSFG